MKEPKEPIVTSSNYCIELTLEEFLKLEDECDYSVVKDTIQDAGADSITYDKIYGTYVFITCIPSVINKVCLALKTFIK